MITVATNEPADDEREHGGSSLSYFVSVLGGRR
jgi:hypothetical protein